jgi:hypothetical protein
MAQALGANHAQINALNARILITVARVKLTIPSSMENAS